MSDLDQPRANISFTDGTLYIRDFTSDGIHYTFSNNTFSLDDLTNILHLLNITKDMIIHLHIYLTSELNIGDRLFGMSLNLNLKSVYLSNTKSIGSYAFEFCKSLESVECSDQLNTIGELAFAYCVSLSSLSSLYELTYIGESAFEYCTSLVTLNGLNKLNTIKNSAFDGCESLEALPKLYELTHIDIGAFTQCPSFKILELSSYSCITFCNKDDIDEEYNYPNLDFIFDEITDDEIDEFHTLYPYINVSRSHYILK